MLDIKEITDNVFKLDNRIRYVAILNHQYDLLASRMREGIASLTPAETDRDFMTLAAPVMIGAADRLRPFCGNIRRVSVRYDRVHLVFYRTTIHLVILSLETQVDQALLDRIGESVRKLELERAEGTEENEV